MDSEIPENTVEFSSTNSKKKKKRARYSNSSSELKNNNKKEKKRQKIDSSSSSKKKKAPVRWSADNITALLTIIRDAVVAGRVHTDSGLKKKGLE